MEKVKQLNTKQMNFCNQYLKDFNATKAAIRAGYSEKSAYSQGHDLLKIPEISENIKAISQSNFKSIGLDVERIIAEIASIAFSDDSSTKEKLHALEVLLKYQDLIKDEDSEDNTFTVEFIHTGSPYASEIEIDQLSELKANSSLL